MKKVVLFLVLTFVTGSSFVSCSRDNDNSVVTKQDFTNPDYIKNILVGKWNGVSSSNNGKIWISLDDPSFSKDVYNTYYTFDRNGEFLHKPYTREDDNSYNEKGTYSIVSATSTADALLILTEKKDNQEFTKTLVLTDYKDDVVTFYEISSLYPSGRVYYKFQKVK